MAFFFYDICIELYSTSIYIFFDDVLICIYIFFLVSVSFCVQSVGSPQGLGAMSSSGAMLSQARGGGGVGMGGGFSVGTGNSASVRREKEAGVPFFVLFCFVDGVVRVV